MRCANCGADNQDDKKFCTSCGKALIQSFQPLTGQGICIRCGKKRPPLGLNFNDVTKRCGLCEKEVLKAKHLFRAVFVKASQDNVIEEREWEQLERVAADGRMTVKEALQFIKVEAINLMQRTLAMAKADQVITPQEEAAIYALKHRLCLSDKDIEQIRIEIEYIKLITNIRQGKIPTTKTTAILGADELCYWDSSAIYMKPVKNGTTPHEGHLIITSKKTMFLTKQGGTDIPHAKLVRVTNNMNGVYLELSRKTGNGFYQVARPDIVGEILHTLARMHNRQLVAISDDEEASRHIPQEVKIAVWHRDQGKCVQCGATDYLEFDHIIPFSKGGASSLNNVQLLCRRCNLKKSDSI